MTVLRHVGITTTHRPGQDEPLSLRLSIPGPADPSPYRFEVTLPFDEAAEVSSSIDYALRRCATPPENWMDWQSAALRLARCLIEIRELSGSVDGLDCVDIERTVAAFGGTDVLRQIETRFAYQLDAIGTGERA